MILYQQLAFCLIICFYFSCISTSTEALKMRSILSLHLFGKVDRGANYGFNIFPCDGWVWRWIPDTCVIQKWDIIATRCLLVKEWTYLWKQKFLHLTNTKIPQRINFHPPPLPTSLYHWHAALHFFLFVLSVHWATRTNGLHHGRIFNSRRKVV